jgi:hypothetical protein
MLRRVVSAVVLLLLCLGLTMAAEIRAFITRVEDNKVTFAENKGKGEPRGDERTLPVVSKVKVVKAVKNKETKKIEAGEEIEHGLKNEMFSKEKLPEKGLPAWIITDEDDKKITEIRVQGKGKKKKDQQ